MNTCEHGEPRGERYCALCRYSGKTAPTTRIDDNVIHLHRYAKDTSVKAGLNALPKTGTKRRLTFDLIKDAGERGLCDHELEQVTGWLHQSASAARNTLMNDGFIKDSGMRRKTPTGNEAIVWIIS